MLRRPSIPRSAALLAVALLATAAPPSGAAGTWKDVAHRGVVVQVPAAWPVVDLGKEPGRCARFDVNVVYLGHEGPGAHCPTVIVGAAEAVHLEPWDASTDGIVRGFPRRSFRGEPARVDPVGRAGGRIVVALERPRMIARFTFGGDEALAGKIASTLRVISGSGSPEPSASGPSPSGPSPSASPPPSAAPEPSAAAAEPSLDVTAAQVNPAPLQPGIFAGDGFDTCAAPALEKMKAWLASPYRAIGIYVGGINHGCKAQDISADWVAASARMGWSFWPLYVGRQAPCLADPDAVKIDPAAAASQGRAAADDAIALADSLGLPTGSPLYFDMEAYSGNSSCISTVHTFLEAWTVRLHERHYISGVYSSEASGINNLAEAYDDPGFVPPDAIWTAHWGESKRIFGHDPDWLPDSLWKNHQRIHQYRGGHLETWGGQTINIDNDFADAPAVRFAAAQRWLSGNIDGAGGTDLVHVCCKDYVNVWFTQGNGTYTVKSFRPWPGYDVQLPGWLRTDLNADGRTDLVHLCCSDHVFVWLSNGDGTFTISSFRPWAGYVLQQGRWSGGDVNGDGRGDLVHICCKDYVLVWLSNGDGTFTMRGFRPWAGYVVQQGTWAGLDVNADGRGDLVHLCCKDYALIWLSNGDGTFTMRGFRPWTGYVMQQGTWAGLDLNADGRGDLVHLCCADSARIWISNGNGTFTMRSFRPWVGYVVQQGRWAVSDVNADGRGDLVHLCCADSARLWLSNGDGSFAMGSFRPWTGYALQSGSWLAGDADADGDGDLFHMCCATRIFTWFSKGDGTYSLVESPI